MTILSVSATASDTLDQTTATQLNSMVHSSVSGKHLAVFSCYLQNSTAAGSETTNFSIYVGGTKVAHSERVYEEETSIDNAYHHMATACVVNPSAENVEVKYIASAASSPLTAYNRELILFPFSGTEVEVTATSDTTWSTTTGTYEALLTATTPSSGEYLCIFSTSANGDSGADIDIRISVGGSPLAHTLRTARSFGSAPNTDYPFFIACKVNVNGSQDVVAEWTNSETTGTLTAHERTLSLIPVDSGELFEANATAQVNKSSTSDDLITSMTITDPGVDDYLVLYSAYHFYNDAPTELFNYTYSIRSGGTKVTNSDRIASTEQSQGFGEIPVMVAAKVSVSGATDDLEMYWQLNVTNTVSTFERTFVAIKESAGIVIPVPLGPVW